MSLSSTIGTALSALALAGAATVAIAAPASATTTSPALTSCHGSTCDGLEPNNTTCSNDAETVRTASASGRLIELRYSPSCRSAWGRISGAAVGDEIDVANSNAESQVAFVHSGNDAHTTMVNDAGLTSTSCGFKAAKTVLACTGAF